VNESKVMREEFLALAQLYGDNVTGLFYLTLPDEAIEYALWEIAEAYHMTRPKKIWPDATTTMNTANTWDYTPKDLLSRGRHHR